MKPRIILADNLHFQKRGFNSLINFMETKNIEHTFISHEKKELLYAYGNYNNYVQDLEKYHCLLEDISDEELFDFKYSTFKIFPLIKAEILTYVMTFENWYSEKISSDIKAIFDKLLKENKEILLLNMAVALYWIDFWKNILKEYPFYTHCCIFSGTLIYQKTLMQLAQNSQMKVMVFEHFFTGHDYYCEHKYQHIPNNSDIKFKNYYENVLNTDNMSKVKFENEKVKAINKILQSNNKNVKQPKESDKITFENDNKILLILGQVVNDFSVLETKLPNISTVTFYKELILKVLETTEYNIIFKAHPWERKKANLSSPLTYDELIKFLKSTNYSQRVKIVEDHNLNELFEISSLIVTLCSQAAIEASFVGKKVVQLGDAFYGKKGFTDDIESIDHFIEQIDSLSGTLSIDEYKDFEIFLLKTLQLHLVSVHPSGIKSLEGKFGTIKTIPLVSSLAVPKFPKVKVVTEKVKVVADKESTKSFLQKLKKVPLLGTSLLWFKHKILRWY